MLFYVKLKSLLKLYDGARVLFVFRRKPLFILTGGKMMQGKVRFILLRINSKFRSYLLNP